jgi:hypothetical protein
MSVYGTGPIKQPRRSRAQIQTIRDAIVEELAADHPQTLRGLYYRLVSRGVIAKTEEEYRRTVSRLLVEMRRSGDVPYGWLADQTRWMRKPVTFSSVEEALKRTAQTYRRALWDEALEVPEIWCEKDAITGVLVDETNPWDVALMPCRGYASLTFLHAAAETIRERGQNGQRTVIYYFGDHDPSGVDIDRYIRTAIGESLVGLEGWPVEEPVKAIALETFEEYADFLRVAVTPGQIKSLNLQTRPTKRKAKDYRAKRFAGDSVEVDAIPARTLRAIAAGCIQTHVDEDQFEVMRTVEEEERAGLMKLASAWRDGGDR